MLNEIQLVTKLNDKGFYLGDTEYVCDISIPAEWLEDNTDFITSNFELNEIEELEPFTENDTEDLLLLCAKHNLFDKTEIVETLINDYDTDASTILNDVFDEFSIDYISNSTIKDNMKIFELLSDSDDEIKLVTLKLNPTKWLDYMIENKNDIQAEDFENEDLSEVLSQAQDDIDILTTYEFTTGLKAFYKKAWLSPSEELTYIKENFENTDNFDKFKNWLEDWFDQDIIDDVLALSDNEIQKRENDNIISKLNNSIERNRISADLGNTIIDKLNISNISISSGYIGLEDMTFDDILVNGVTQNSDTMGSKIWISGRSFGDNNISFDTFKSVIKNNTDNDIDTINLQELIVS